MSEPRVSVESRWKGTEHEPSIERMREIISELAVRDEEHPDAWLTHSDSGWILRLDEDRFAYLEDPECKIVAHMESIGPEQALQLWFRFATGGRQAIHREPWRDGGPHVSPVEQAAREARAKQLQLESDRSFYEILGTELQDLTCRFPGCTRGHIQHSVLCRVHHFEQIRGRKCPFDY